MPLVFVHGVNTRRGNTPALESVFNNRVAFFKEQFRSTAFAAQVTAPEGLHVFTPYWGDLGVEFAKNLACIPKDGIQTLSTTEPESILVTEVTAAHLDGVEVGTIGLREAPLLSLAKSRSLATAVDLLFTGATTAPLLPILLSPTRADAARTAAVPVYQAAIAYATVHTHPAWLDTIAITSNADSQFIDTLLKEVANEKNEIAPAEIQSLSFGSSDLGTWLKNAARSIKKAVGRIITPVGAVLHQNAVEEVRKGYLKLSHYVRPSISRFIGHFFGDVFTYMQNRQLIIDRVLTDIHAALDSRRTGDDRLYLVGHSFGGVILYDILTQFEPDLPCDLWVTVGSQVALFAEIGQLAAQKEIDVAFAGPLPAIAPRPKTVSRWLNIFDSTDVVGFATKGVFSGVWDYRFETDAYPIVAHGAYFDSPRLYMRLADRVAQVMRVANTDGPAPQ